MITGCPVPAADTTVGNFRGVFFWVFFFLPRSELAHQRNVRRENIENMTHMLLKQIKQRALLTSGCPGGTGAGGTAHAFHFGATGCLCSAYVASATLFHSASWGRSWGCAKQDGVQSPGQPWFRVNKKPFFSNRFGLKQMLGSHSYF